MVLLAAETGILNSQLHGDAFLEASDINDIILSARTEIIPSHGKKSRLRGFKLLNLFRAPGRAHV